MRLAGIRNTSLFDGIGVNYVIFVQGCHRHCKGCQNPSTWCTSGGYEITVNDIIADIEKLKLITGITFSGGEPILQFDAVNTIAKYAKKKGLRTTLYTGYLLKDISNYPLDNFDYIIDGEFVESERTLSLPYRGSDNQKILMKGEDY